ncbi:hypothetical protein C6T71_03035, partial [Burkholderia multivorans]
SSSMTSRAKSKPRREPINQSSGTRHLTDQAESIQGDAECPRILRYTDRLRGHHVRIDKLNVEPAVMGSFNRYTNRLAWSACVERGVVNHRIIDVDRQMMRRVRMR